jgi:endonuclease/exonuclease/phosphatase family metal-dependent hydrolase
LLFALLWFGPASAETLKVATWNLDWLTLRPEGDPALPADVHARAAEDWGRLRGYAAQLNADVVALEEVDGPEVAAKLFPGSQLFFTHDHVIQRVGFAVRPGLRVTVHPDLASLDPDPGAFHPLRSGADITVDFQHSALRLLAVHLKAGCNRDPLTRSRRSQCETLALQIPVLQAWIAARAAEGVPFLLLGDFNRHLEGRDEMMAALQQAAPLKRATEGYGDPCWGGGTFIDHILAGGPARGWMAEGGLRVLVYREMDPSWQAHLSDHCPVSARLDVP